MENNRSKFDMFLELCQIANQLDQKHSKGEDIQLRNKRDALCFQLCYQPKTGITTGYDSRLSYQNFNLFKTYSNIIEKKMKRTYSGKLYYFVYNYSNNLGYIYNSDDLLLCELETSYAQGLLDKLSRFDPSECDSIITEFCDLYFDKDFLGASKSDE